MTDLIKRAIRSYERKQERVARGYADDHRIHVIKKKKWFNWELIVKVNNRIQYKRNRSPSKADSLFDKYKDKYDLTEVDKEP